MASNIKLLNANGKTLEIVNSDTNLTDVTIDGGKILAQTDTIASLRAMVEKPSTIYATGYHTANDGAFGSNFFKLATDTGQVDNSGTIIRTVNGVYELQYDGSVNVRWFGTVGDGVTDDDTAISNAQVVVNITNAPLYYPSGAYLRGATVYNIDGDSVWYDSNFSGGVNSTSSLENASILVTTETDEDAILTGTKSRIGVSVTAVARGAQHSSGVRSNLNNYSTDGQGCTAVYARATSDTLANWQAALHGETRHGGGTSIGISSENSCYSTAGTLYGAVINLTTGGAETLNTITGLGKEIHPTATGLLILGSKATYGDIGTWKTGIKIDLNAVRSTGSGIDLLSSATYGIRTGLSSVNSTADILLQGASNIGIALSGNYTSGIALKMKADNKIGFEASGVIRMGWESGVSRLTMDNAGERIGFAVSGTPAMYMSAVKVVGTRRTGYTIAMSGAANRATSYDTSTITLAQLAERVKALQDDLATHGLIGV